MHKSLKLASIILATASILHADIKDNTFIVDFNYGQNTAYPKDGDTPGAQLEAAGSASNFGQHFTTLGAGLTIELGLESNFIISIYGETQPQAVTYANPSGLVEIEQTEADVGNAPHLFLGAHGTNANDLTEITQSPTSVVATIEKPAELEARKLADEPELGNGELTQAYIVTTDTGGKQVRDTYTGLTVQFAYNLNETVQTGIFISKGTAGHTIGGLAVKNVRETKIGASVRYRSTQNGGYLELRKVFIADSEADISSDGASQQMDGYSVHAGYTVNISNR